MERKKQFSIDRLPGRDLMRLDGFVQPGVIERAFNTPTLIPEKGVGKYSIRRAVERHNFYQTSNTPEDPKEAKRQRRQKNQSLYSRR